MIKALELPEFLWEATVVHAAYLQNMSYTKPRAKETPYQIWHGRKPNVLHLCKFGTPVWVLLQGQRIQRKMLPKSQRRAYVRYNKGSKSVKYYNTATRNILILRNFRFLSPMETTPPEEITIEHDAPLEGEHGPPCEGEWENDTHSTTEEEGAENPRKRKAEATIDTQEP